MPKVVRFCFMDLKKPNPTGYAFFQVGSTTKFSKVVVKIFDLPGKWGVGVFERDGQQFWVLGLFQPS